MVEFGKRYHKDDKLSFELLDITASNVPLHFHGNFSHVFSIYCLHFVSNLRQAMKNIHLMLKPEGEVFLSHMSKMPMFDAYESLSQQTKWKPFMVDYRNKMNFCHQYSKNSVQLFEDLLVDIGFKVNVCIEEKRLIIYSKEYFLGISLNTISQLSNETLL
ncbi:juvenile hormone acid O-methyltransferase-like [Photinus pyralis]|uniref:juvenile hormone acid O-methyltransferase-like n=1 Tax=Photinus pyralis TaxID=7054 RepID=UPI0012674072|nr:juvenile hormone acid O-methyltransferase-like [Photinus pyralis]